MVMENTISYALVPRGRFWWFERWPSPLQYSHPFPELLPMYFQFTQSLGDYPLPKWFWSLLKKTLKETLQCHAYILKKLKEIKIDSKFPSICSKFKSVLKVVVYFSSNERNTENRFLLEPATKLIEFWTLRNWTVLTEKDMPLHAWKTQELERETTLWDFWGNFHPCK